MKDPRDTIGDILLWLLMIILLFITFPFWLYRKIRDKA